MEKLVEKKKHNHKLTNWLKVLIFSMVMLAPFFAVLSKVIYVQSNQNAKESYYGETINNYQVVSVAQNDYKLNTRYYYYNSVLVSQPLLTSSYNLYVDNLKLVDSANITTTLIESINMYTQYRLYYTTYNNANLIQFYYYGEDNAYHWLASLNQSIIISFTINSFTTGKEYYLYQYVYNRYSYLDNVFYYAVEQLHDNQLFNWAKNTGIYNAIDGMTTGLNMGANNTLALLLAYWSILIAVYIVFDIIIFIFTKITHFINE